MEDKELIERSPTDKQESVKASGVAVEPSSEDLKRLIEEVRVNGEYLAAEHRLMGDGKRDFGRIMGVVAQQCDAAPVLARALTAANKRLERTTEQRNEACAALTWAHREGSLNHVDMPEEHQATLMWAEEVSRAQRVKETL